MAPPGPAHEDKRRPSPPPSAPSRFERRTQYQPPDEKRAESDYNRDIGQPRGCAVREILGAGPGSLRLFHEVDDLRRTGGAACGTSIVTALASLIAPSMRSADGLRNRPGFAGQIASLKPDDPHHRTHLNPVTKQHDHDERHQLSVKFFPGTAERHGGREEVCGRVRQRDQSHHSGLALAQLGAEARQEWPTAIDDGREREQDVAIAGERQCPRRYRTSAGSSPRAAEPEGSRPSSPKSGTGNRRPSRHGRHVRNSSNRPRLRPWDCRSNRLDARPCAYDGSDGPGRMW